MIGDSVVQPGPGQVKYGVARGHCSVELELSREEFNKSGQTNEQDFEKPFCQLQNKKKLWLLRVTSLCHEREPNL
jgi:hypothetical protein